MVMETVITASEAETSRFENTEWILCDIDGWLEGNQFWKQSKLVNNTTDDK